MDSLVTLANPKKKSKNSQFKRHFVDCQSDCCTSPRCWEHLRTAPSQFPLHHSPGQGPQHGWRLWNNVKHCETWTLSAISAHMCTYMIIYDHICAHACMELHRKNGKKASAQWLAWATWHCFGSSCKSMQKIAKTHSWTILCGSAMFCT